MPSATCLQISLTTCGAIAVNQVFEVVRHSSTVGNPSFTNPTGAGRSDAASCRMAAARHPFAVRLGMSGPLGACRNFLIANTRWSAGLELDAVIDLRQMPAWIRVKVGKNLR